MDPIPRTPAQAAASRANGSRSGGPSTAAGRARSSFNSVEHGLRALEFIVLPAEDPQEIVRHLRTVLADLGVMSETEVAVGKMIALRLWQKQRIETLDARRLRAEVDNRLAETPEAKALRALEDAVAALRVMADTMACSFPTERDALDQLLVPCRNVASLLELAEEAAHPVGLKALREALDDLTNRSATKTDANAYATVRECALASAERVEQLLPAAKSDVDKKRVEIAAQMPIGEDRNVLLRRRYVADLDRRLAADMRLLAQLKEQRAVAGSGSLGHPPAEVKVRLVR